MLCMTLLSLAVLHIWLRQCFEDHFGRLREVDEDPIESGSTLLSSLLCSLAFCPSQAQPIASLLRL